MVNQPLLMASTLPQVSPDTDPIRHTGRPGSGPAFCAIRSASPLGRLLLSSTPGPNEMPS
ncbi:Uncharacterised protein [Mycobacteroides abscessus subsp. abscessus]|nr:Uncharacterised protein [Mycobacteroides abscessus subsp. abscessus]SIM23380.1 Uncharacterised protein [Mycobacteroides abscessus subsp. abscessus]